MNVGGSSENNDVRSILNELSSIEEVHVQFKVVRVHVM